MVAEKVLKPSQVIGLRSSRIAWGRTLRLPSQKAGCLNHVGRALRFRWALEEQPSRPYSIRAGGPPAARKGDYGKALDTNDFLKSKAREKAIWRWRPSDRPPW